MVPKGTAVSKLLATLKHTREPYQMLLLPATSFIGAEQAFMAANYNSVSCKTMPITLYYINIFTKFYTTDKWFDPQP